MDVSGVRGFTYQPVAEGRGLFDTTICHLWVLNAIYVSVFYNTHTKNKNKRRTYHIYYA